MFHSLTSLGAASVRAKRAKPVPLLLLRYDFSLRSGTTDTLADVSGAGNANAVATVYGTTSHVTTIGTAQITSGITGPLKADTKCYYLPLDTVNSSSSNYIQLAANASVTIERSDYSYSFSFWMYPLNSTANGDCKVWEMIGSESLLMWRQNKSTTYCFNNDMSKTFNIFNNTWTHVVICCDHNTKKMQLYLNGVAKFSEGSLQALTANHFFPSGKLSTLRFCRALTTAHMSFAGALADFRIYTKVMTADEVSKLYQGTM